MFSFTAFLSSVAQSLPEMLIWLIGIIFAIRSRKQYPIRSRLAIIGCAVLLLTSPIFIAISMGVVIFTQVDQSAKFDISTMLQVVGIAHGLAVMIGGAFLIAALFGPRANTRGTIDDDLMLE